MAVSPKPTMRSFALMLTQVVQSAIRRKDGWVNDIYPKIYLADERCPNRAALTTVRRVAIILWAKFRDQRRAAPTQKIRAAA